MRKFWIVRDRQHVAHNIFGAASEDEAWGLFEREVLERLEWEGDDKF
jgi:hypothetical protein